MGLFTFIRDFFGLVKSANKPSSSKSQTQNQETVYDEYLSNFLSEAPLTKDEFYEKLNESMGKDYIVERDFIASELDGYTDDVFDFCLKDGDTVVCCVLLLKQNEIRTGRYARLLKASQINNIPLVHFYNKYLNKPEYIKERINKRLA